MDDKFNLDEDIELSDLDDEEPDDFAGLDDLDTDESQAKIRDIDDDDNIDLDDSILSDDAEQSDADSSEQSEDDSEQSEDDNYSLLNEEMDDESDTSDSESDHVEADDDGTVIDGDDLLSEDTDDDENARIISQRNSSNNFLGDTPTQISVASSDTNQDTFRMVYADIGKIAVTKRIRTSQNVDDLQKQISETGLLEPITVGLTRTEGVYVLLDGFRRLIACAKLGKTKIPCVINRNINTADIPIVTALYNKNKVYTIKEIIEYISYLEKDMGIMNPQLIEYMLPLNPGDYNKLKDVLADNDDDILDKLYSGIFTIDQAFKKVEKNRKSMTQDEKDMKKLQQATENGQDMEKVKDQGEELSQAEDEGSNMTEEQLNQLGANAQSLDDNLDDQSVEEMDKAANEIDNSFKPHQQKVGEREYIDPNLKKQVMARDGYKCWCCKTGGEAFVDVLDFHHIIPVFLGGKDTKENAVMLCLTCHRMVHLYQTRDLYLPDPKSEDEVNAMTDGERAMYEAERNRYKRIIKLGTFIREGMHQKGMNLQQYKKEHPIGNIGRNKPGQGQEKA